MPEPLRIAWIIDSLGRGGAERLALALAAAPPPECELRLFALRPPRPDPAVGGAALWGKTWNESAGRRRQLGMRRIYDAIEFRRLYVALRDFRPDLIHCHLRYATLWTAVAARGLHAPWMTTLHRLPGRERGGRQRVLAHGEELAWRAAARVLCVSQSQAEAWRLFRRGRPLPHLRILPNGILARPPATPELRAGLRQRHGIAPAALVFLTIAAVRARKGWRTWLAAASRIAARLPQAQFIWVGDGEELAALQEQVVQRGDLRGRVRLTGGCPDVGPWLRLADMFLFPSDEEAQPTAVLEAMDAGLPIVASDLRAHAEVLGSSACLVPAGDAQAMADAALALAAPAAAARRRAMGAAARDRCAHHYAFAAWRTALVEHYREAATGATARVGNRKAGATPPVTLLMVEFFSHGGLWHYSRQLGTALAARGAEGGVAVALLTGRFPEAMELPSGELRILPRLLTWNPHHQPRRLPRRLVRFWRGGRYLIAWWQIVRCVQRMQPAAVLFGDFEHRCDGWFVAWLRRRGHRLGVVWHNLEAFDRYHKRRLTRPAAWRPALLRHFDAIFVHGDTLAAAITRQTGHPALVMRHGCGSWTADEAGADPGLDQRLDLTAGRPVALLLGTLTKYKGIATLIAALARLPPEIRPLAVIAGRPGADLELAALKALAQRLGVAGWLRWDVRYVPNAELAWYFRRADWVVLPYLTASQSGVAHLALAAGKPLIVSRVGALAELIDGNGVVVEPGDAGDLSVAMAGLARSAELRARMGRRSSELAAQRHNWSDAAGYVLAGLGLGSPRRRRGHRPFSCTALHPNTGSARSQEEGTLDARLASDRR